VLDGRPGKVKELIDNPLANLSIEEKRVNPDFLTFTNQLRKELH